MVEKVQMHGDGQQVLWRDLPKKRQLAISTLAQLAELLTHNSLRAFMYCQLRWFYPDLPDSTIPSLTGFLETSSGAAQFFTAFLWGRAADSESCGRNTVLLIGLSAICPSPVGFGFSRLFLQAVCFRALGGGQMAMLVS